MPNTPAQPILDLHESLSAGAWSVDLEQIMTSCEAILLETDPDLNRLHARAIKHLATELLEDLLNTAHGYTPGYNLSFQKIVEKNHREAV